MSPTSYFLGFSKRVTVICGAVVAISAAYVVVGLPIPATEASVTAKLLPFSVALSEFKSSQKLILNDLSAVQRNQLRTERFTLEKAMSGASSVDKISFQLRIGQIDDEMIRLARRDEDVYRRGDTR